MDLLHVIKKRILILPLIVFPFLGCSEDDDCGSYACFTPPRFFQFDITDKSSGENVFANGTYNKADISVTNSQNNTPVEYNLISNEEINRIEIFSIGWQTEMITVNVALAEETVFQLFVDAERRTEDCCSSTEYNEIELTGADFELNNETEIYRVFVD